MSECTDNDRLERSACGDHFSGELQHCVAKASWATWPDGMVHMTASQSVIDNCWREGTKGEIADPATLGYEQDDHGRWRMPMSEEDRARLAAVREAQDG